MTSETPCLSGCCQVHKPGAKYQNCAEADLSYAMSGSWPPMHISACACGNRYASGQHGPQECEPVTNAKPAKSAEPPACKCGHGKPPHEMDDSCGECTASKCACGRYDPKQEPQSEPPIDWEAAERWATERAGALAGLGTSPDLNLSKSYLALKAENAALEVRVGELSESLLWATSSYEERVVILANREKRKEQEASNGK